MSRMLIKRYERADADAREFGMAWYAGARNTARRMARRHGLTLSQAAGIIASASLNQSWKGNLTLAERLCAGESVGLTTVRRESASILAGWPPCVVIGGPKRKNFYRNIMGNTDAVTVDRWAARAADAERLLQRKGGYETIATMYREAAAKLNITPRELQAVVWCEVRGSHS